MRQGIVFNSLYLIIYFLMINLLHLSLTSQILPVMVLLLGSLPLSGFILNGIKSAPLHFLALFVGVLYCTYPLSFPHTTIDYARIFFALALAATYLLQALMIHTFMGRYIGHFLEHEDDIVKFFILIALPIVFVISLLNSYIFHYFLTLEFSFIKLFAMHFLGNLAGTYLIVSIITGFIFNTKDKSPTRTPGGYHYIAFVSLAMILLLTLTPWSAVVYLLIPLLLISMLRLSYLFSSILLTSMALFFILMTAIDLGPFSGQTVEDNFISMLLFCTTMTFGVNFLLMQHRKISLHHLTSDAINESNKALFRVQEAINNKAILAYYQPIFNKNKEIVKYETLMRIHYHGALMSPHQFLEIAKETPYYPMMSRMIFKQAFETFKENNELFSINISSLDILNHETLDYLKELLEDFPDKERVVFELVESESIEKSEYIEEFIHYIKAMGAKLAIDDFGAGYSNFSYLNYLEPDYLKLDGSIIKDIHKNERALKVASGLVKFAKELGIQTIAEFIHSKEVFEKAKEIGVDEFQGFYLGEPKRTLRRIDTHTLNNHTPF